MRHKGLYRPTLIQLNNYYDDSKILLHFAETFNIDKERITNKYKDELVLSINEKVNSVININSK